MTQEQRDLIEEFSLRVLIVYYFVAIIFAISGLVFLGYLIALMGAVLAFALGGT